MLSFIVLEKVSLKATREITNDLYNGKSNNDFVKDENGILFKKAVEELEKYGVKCYALCNVVDDLMWHVCGDTEKIKKLQSKLNFLGVRGRNGQLKEDGVYGKETLTAWNSFFEKLVKSSLPTLVWVDPLQTKITGITYKHEPNTKPKHGNKIYDHYDMKRLTNPYEYSILLIKKAGKVKPDRLFMFDKPHFIRSKGEKAVGYHMNFDEDYPNFFRKRLDHKQIPEDIYFKLKDFGETAKKVRVAGRVLLVAYVALDIIELSKTISIDLKDSDKKLGRKTTANVAEIAGTWGGSIAGQK